MGPVSVSLGFMDVTAAEDLVQTSAVAMVYAKLMGSANVKMDGQGLIVQQRSVMNNVVCMEGFAIMVNVSSVVQIMRATLVKRVLQYCPACQCVMMYLLEIRMGSIVHQVNSAYYNSLKL